MSTEQEKEVSTTIPSTAIVTSIYREFWGTEQFYKSTVKTGLHVVNAHKDNWRGNGNAMKLIYETYKDLKGKYDYAIYSDGADSYFVKGFEPPKDEIVYSAEKACYPLKSLEADYPVVTSPWRYFNAGGCSGPLELLIEFYERYGLNQYEGKDVTGQLELSRAYLQALKDEFPIRLDTDCEIFQTTAFEDPGDFTYSEGRIWNNITGTEPSLFHGNGRTNLSWIYNMFPKATINEERTFNY